MPKAETEKDLQAEREIVAHVIARNPDRYDNYLHLSEYGYRVDGVLTQKHRFGYAVPRLFYEAKDRDIVWGQYASGVMISVSKVVTAHHLTSVTGLPSAFFARFNDGVVAGVPFTKARIGDLRIGGRDDRPDYPHDIEPVAMFRWDDFKILHDPRAKAA
jgi:hypothetical protein